MTYHLMVPGEEEAVAAVARAAFEDDPLLNEEIDLALREGPWPYALRHCKLSNNNAIVMIWRVLAGLASWNRADASS